MILFFLPLLIYAMNIDFSMCYNKYKFIKKLIPVSRNKSVTFYKTSKYLYFDPFTRLYVVLHKNNKVIKFFSNPKIGWWMGSIKNNSCYVGSYAQKGYFINFYKLSVKTVLNGVVSDIFCRAYGVSNDRGFLDTKRLFHFVKYGYWGDIGINIGKDMIVISSDPFYTSVKPNEKVLLINGNKATPQVWTDIITLGKIGDRVKIKTDKREYFLKIRKLKYLFTPLEYFGIRVDKNLTAYLPNYLANKYFLKQGKIIEINGKKVHSFKELLYLLSFNKDVTILLEKDGINIEIKDLNGRVY